MTFRELKVSDMLRRFADLLDNPREWEKIVQSDPGLVDLGKLVGVIRTYCLMKTRIDLAPGAVTASEGEPIVTNKPNQIKLPFGRNSRLGGL